MMTVKEAILKSLEDISGIANYMEIHNHIIAHKYYDFGSTKTPSATISAQLGDLIRTGDARIKRVKLAGETYSYYLTKNEQNIPIEIIVQRTEAEISKKDKGNIYAERDLHILLSSYLQNSGIFSKTIFHEQSTYGKDNNQIWTHPDIVGVRFLNLQSKASQAFLKAVSRADTFKLSSYEIKKEINSDSELKKAF